MSRMSSSLPLYLASASPRRRQLLTQAHIPYELLPSQVDEEALTADYQGEPEELGQYLAIAKALAARTELLRKGKWGRILTADTTVLLDGHSLGKPADPAEAYAMLRQLRGREHLVATGVALAQENGCIVSATSRTRVRMRDYGEDELMDYVATGDSLDKAGGYGVQHPGFQPVQAISGCHLGVIGLPICIIHALLEKSTPPPASSRCPWSDACTATQDLESTP